MEILLIIRAPTQNIEDQAINCSSDWTVLRLKNHLSEVYPSRPLVHDQKLIYSGHLLHDHLQLKDILRHDDMPSSVQILHLVCTGKNYQSSQVEASSSSQNWPSHSTDMQSPELSNDNTENTSENILRHRVNSQTPQTNDIQMQFQQMPLNAFPTFSGDPQMMAQIAAMQQMYTQYISQYWQNVNMAVTTENPHFVTFPPNIQVQPNNPGNNLQENIPQQQPVANLRNNPAAVQPVEDNEYANRDWLDHLFLYFRFLILLCIVYFYTTPERFMLVIVMVVVAFLYHEGWFVRQGIADAVIGQRNRGQAEPNQNAANDQPNDDEGLDGQELEAAMDGEEPPHANNNNNQVFSPLTFLTTFFSSLIPEQPPPVNIN